jgi:cellulose synthase/poly-beta-1,6-N-acetylglucosamine synthase-like glycosyltransferase
MNTLYWIFWIALIIVFYTYLGYGAVLIIMVKIKEFFVKPKVKQLPAELPDVTLFITAYNEQAVVSEKMKNCETLDYPTDKLHVVWVTDGSDDRTNDLLKEYTDVTVYFTSERKGKTAAMNRGMSFIHTPIVAFTDANTYLNKGAIKEIVKQFTDPRVGCVAGEKRIEEREENNAAGGGEGIYWKYESILKDYDSRLYSTVGAAGELFALRSELYEAVGTDTLLDDFMLSMNIAREGYKIAYCKEAYAVEGGSASIYEEQKRKVRISAGGLQSVWRLRGLLNPLKYGLLSFQYISHRVLRWSVTPWMLFLLFPLNIVIVCLQPSFFYTIILILQISFYFMGLRGKQLADQNIKSKILFVPYYFLFMNVNVIKGIRYLYKRRGGTNASWEKSKRK